MNPETWQSAASVELYPLFAYLNALDIKTSSFEETLSFVMSTDLSATIADFLREYVGSGENKVTREPYEPGSEKIVGLDGQYSTCPIAVAPSVAMRYFSQSAAEYLLMQSLAQTWNRFETE